MDSSDSSDINACAAAVDETMLHDTESHCDSDDSEQDSRAAGNEEIVEKHEPASDDCASDDSYDRCDVAGPDDSGSNSGEEPVKNTDLCASDECDGCADDMFHSGSEDSDHSDDYIPDSGSEDSGHGDDYIPDSGSEDSGHGDDIPDSGSEDSDHGDDDYVRVDPPDNTALVNAFAADDYETICACIRNGERLEWDSEMKMLDMTKETPDGRFHVGYKTLAEYNGKRFEPDTDDNEALIAVRNQDVPAFLRAIASCPANLTAGEGDWTGYEDGRHPFVTPLPGWRSIIRADNGRLTFLKHAVECGLGLDITSIQPTVFGTRHVFHEAARGVTRYDFELLCSLLMLVRRSRIIRFGGECAIGSKDPRERADYIADAVFVMSRYRQTWMAPHDCDYSLAEEYAPIGEHAYAMQVYSSFLTCCGVDDEFFADVNRALFGYWANAGRTDMAMFVLKQATHPDYATHFLAPPMTSADARYEIRKAIAKRLEDYRHETVPASSEQEMLDIARLARCHDDPTLAAESEVCEFSIDMCGARKRRKYARDASRLANLLGKYKGSDARTGAPAYGTVADCNMIYDPAVLLYKARHQGVYIAGRVSALLKNILAKTIHDDDGTNWLIGVGTELLVRSYCGSTYERYARAQYGNVLLAVEEFIEVVRSRYEDASELFHHIGTSAFARLCEHGEAGDALDAFQRTVSANTARRAGPIAYPVFAAVFLFSGVEARYIIRKSMAKMLESPDAAHDLSGIVELAELHTNAAFDAGIYCAAEKQFCAENDGGISGIKVFK